MIIVHKSYDREALGSRDPDKVTEVSQKESTTHGRQRERDT